MSASEPRLVRVHEPRGRDCSEERTAKHLTLHGAAGAAQAAHAMPAGHLRGNARAAPHEPFVRSLLVSSGHLERASRGSRVDLQL